MCTEVLSIHPQMNPKLLNFCLRAVFFFYLFKNYCKNSPNGFFKKISDFIQELQGISQFIFLVYHPSVFGILLCILAFIKLLRKKGAINSAFFFRCPVKIYILSKNTWFKMQQNSHTSSVLCIYTFE